MKCIGVLLGITVLFVCGAGAQVMQQDQSLLAWGGSPTSPYGISAATFAAATPSALSFALPGAAALPLPEPAAEPQRAQGVFPDYTLDVYAGYSFVRFYALPNAR